jgi:hypothetical protein
LPQISADKRRSEIISRESTQKNANLIWFVLSGENSRQNRTVPFVSLLDEQVFRYNNRAIKKHFVSDGDLFRMAVSQITDKRVTYDQLIGRRAEQP